MPEAKNDKPDELKPVGPGAELDDEVVTTQADDDDDDTRAAAAQATTDDDPDAGADDDERIGHADDDDPDRTQLRQRRRAEKQRRKENRQRERKELNFLRMRNEQLERRFSGLEDRTGQNEVLAIDQRISELKSNIDLAESTYAEAITGQKGSEAAEALKIRDQLRDELQKTEGIKARVVGQDQIRRRQAVQIPPAIQSRINEWMQENDWFDPTLNDEDSTIAKALEGSVARAGFDPRTEEYWQEVTKRCKKRLPHLFETERRNGNGSAADDDPEDPDEPARRPKNGGGPRITTGGRERPLRKGEVFVSRERREAMEEAGVWDDPQLRAKYLAQYARYDKEHGRRNH